MFVSFSGVSRDNTAVALLFFFKIKFLLRSILIKNLSNSDKKLEVWFSVQLILMSADTIDEVKMKETYLVETLTHPAIINKQYKGLWMSLQFETPEITKIIAANCVSNGVITDWFLFAEDRIRIAPPLSITMEELAIAVQKIKESINDSL